MYIIIIHTIGIAVTGEFNGNNMLVADNILEMKKVFYLFFTGIGPTAVNNNSILGGYGILELRQ